MMDFFDVVCNRSSVKSDFLDGGAPSIEILRRILSSAATAPDHGKLRPWRFDVYMGEGRHTLKKAFDQALAKEEQSQVLQDKMARRILKSPLTLVVKTHISQENKKIPEWEQVLSTMAATQNVLNAFYACHMGAILVTGAHFSLPAVEELLCHKEEKILGLIYAGNITEKTRSLFASKERPNVDDYSVFIQGDC